MYLRAVFLIFAFSLTLITPISAPALTFKSIPATQWGYIYGSGNSANLTTTPQSPRVEIGRALSKWNLEYIGVPDLSLIHI